MCINPRQAALKVPQKCVCFCACSGRLPHRKKKLQEEDSTMIPCAHLDYMKTQTANTSWKSEELYSSWCAFWTVMSPGIFGQGETRRTVRNTMSAQAGISCHSVSRILSSFWSQLGHGTFHHQWQEYFLQAVSPWSCGLGPVLPGSVEPFG